MSYTRLRYHIITATHRRRPWLTPEVERAVLETIERELEDMGGRCVIANGARDHVHVLCEIPVSVTLQDAISRLKSRSSRAAKAHCAAFRWQVGYACYTVWMDRSQVLYDYIACQKERHGLRPEWEWA